MKIVTAMSQANVTSTEEPYQIVDFVLKPEQQIDMTFNPDRVMISLYAALIAVSLVGNTLLALIILKYKYHKVPANMFLLNLTAADLLVTTVCMPVQLSKAITLVWFYGSIVCKMVSYLQGVSVAASVFTIASMSVDRYLAITPDRRLRSCGRRSVCALLAAVWLAALLVFYPVLHVSAVRTELVPVYTRTGNVSKIVHKKMDFCVEGWAPKSDGKKFGIFSFTIIYVIPGTITMLSYVFMGRTLWSSRPPQHDGDPAHAGALQALRLMTERRRLAFVLLVIASLFTVCWLPYNLLMLLLDLAFLRPRGAVSSTLPYLLFLGHVNSALNPIACFLITKNFRRSLWKLLCSRQSNGGGAPYACVNSRLQASSSSHITYHGTHRKCFLKQAHGRQATWNLEAKYRLDLRVQTAPPTAARSSRRRMGAQAGGALQRRTTRF